ncbi:hypothetical protein [Streptomyces sp. NPDC054783]
MPVLPAGHRALTSNKHRLQHPDQLYIYARNQTLVFREHNQGARSWGALLKDLDQADPGVHVLAHLADRQAPWREPWMDRLSWMAVEIVLAASLHAPQHLSDFLYEPDPEYAQIGEESCGRLPFPAYPTNGFEGSRWLLGADVLLRDEEGCAPVRARTEEATGRSPGPAPGRLGSRMSDSYTDSPHRHHIYRYFLTLNSPWGDA